MKVFFVISLLVYLSIPFNVFGAGNHEVGINKLEEVYTWDRISYNINGYKLMASRSKNPVRQSENGDDYVIPDNDDSSYAGNDDNNNNKDEPYFNQYDNIPFGIDKWHDKLFITIPRIEKGIPSTLNYLDLKEDKEKSPSLRPYPSLKANSLDSETSLVNVFRTRVDVCDRLWMLDTGATQRLENLTYQFKIIQPPAIVIYDLKTNERIGRYELKIEEDYMYNNPTGFGSITVDVSKTDCSNAYAYLPNYETNTLGVYCLKENTYWLVKHNFFHFDPEEGDFNIAGYQYQWNAGIFSVALGPVQKDGYRTAYFHAMASYKERSVSTKILRNQTLANANYHEYKSLGDRGASTQTSMHIIQESTGVMFSTQIGRCALTCWNTNKPFKKQNFGIVAQDSSKLTYLSDVKIDEDDNVWIMSNSYQVYFYSTLKKDTPNFKIYKTSVKSAVSRTVCA